MVQRSVLTAEPVQMFELSSGSTTASKLVPYTKSLKSEFQRGIAPWIYNLYTNIPDLQGGPAYWSITPLTDGKRFTTAGIPIGFESDSEYLGFLGKWLVDSVMAVPNVVKNISERGFISICHTSLSIAPAQFTIDLRLEPDLFESFARTIA